MTRPDPNWSGLRKEARALSPALAASAISVAAVGLLGGRRDSELGWVIYFVGSVALAALSVGHEYTHGTLPHMLSLPVDRRRLLFVKLAALLPMLAVLWAIAVAVLPTGPEFGPSEYPLASLVCGLLVAPWLTMVCRGPLAGAMFAGSVPATMHIVAELAAAARYGWDDVTPERVGFRATVLLAGLAGAATISAIASWRKFMRLEAIEGRAPGLDLSRWWVAAAAQARRRNPLWLLAMKELRLQQMTILVAVFSAVGWVTTSVVWRDYPAGLRILNVVGSVGYAALALLIGALASAEERQMGTHEWQSLLPIAAWQQWAIKVGMAVGLAIVLSVGMPALLGTDSGNASLWPVWIVTILTIGGLYLSSLCRSGLLALAWSVPVLLTASLIGFPSGFLVEDGARLLTIAVTLSAVAALWFGFENHRLARPDLRRVPLQLGVIAAAPLLVGAIARW